MREKRSQEVWGWGQEAGFPRCQGMGQIGENVLIFFHLKSEKKRDHNEEWAATCWCPLSSSSSFSSSVT